MGCCFSTTRTQNQNQNPDDQNGLKNQQPQQRSPEPKSNATHELDHRSPPPPPPPSPPPVEEESVKEVLSETPISKPHQVSILTEETNTQMPIVQHQAEKFETKGPINKAEEVSEASQLSELCSMSDSLSTATTATITEKREEDEATSKRSSREGTQRWNRSPSDASSRKRPYAVDGNVTGGRERRVKSPARRSEPSPEKKGHGGSRSVRGRESGQVATRKLNAGSAGIRRDSGEGSGRRSRSPSCSRAGKVGAGGGRSQLKPPAKSVEKENSGSDGVGGKNDGVPQEEESLENPHVSMECFIFL